MTMITLATSDQFPLAALHVPSRRGPGRALVLIQEIFGINAAMRSAAQAWAELGFEVLCPDLFGRQRAGVELDPRVPEQFKAGVDLMQGMDPALALQDLVAACDWFTRQQPGRPVAALGYCLGGRLAVQMALQAPVSAAVSYYGVGLEGLLPAAPTRIAPTLLHIAEKDAFSTDAARAEVLARVARLPDVVAQVYPGCDHAFARPDGEHYDAAAAQAAQARTLAFLGA